MVKDDQSGHVYDLRPLQKLQTPLKTHDIEGNQYELSICSALSKGLFFGTLRIFTHIMGNLS